MSVCKLIRALNQSRCNVSALSPLSRKARPTLNTVEDISYVITYTVQHRQTDAQTFQPFTTLTHGNTVFRCPEGLWTPPPLLTGPILLVSFHRSRGDTRERDRATERQGNSTAKLKPTKILGLSSSICPATAFGPPHRCTMRPCYEARAVM